MYGTLKWKNVTLYRLLKRMIQSGKSFYSTDVYICIIVMLMIDLNALCD